MPAENGPTARREKIAFGDFQTPGSLARDVCLEIYRQGYRPVAVIEPTCGVGSFLLAAADEFPTARKLIGVEINGDHLKACASAVSTRADFQRFELVRESFFDIDWRERIGHLADPLLVIGNPPWVTNSTQGKLDANNLPLKSNWQEHNGIEALTGKSNFDISEWMLEQLATALNGRNAVLAMLCKTAVARRVLAFAWKRSFQIGAARLYRIDALGAFRAAVEACLLVIEFRPDRSDRSAICYPSLLAASPESIRFGLVDDQLVADIARYEKTKDFQSAVPRNRRKHSTATWRSGIKHDCSAIMELTERDGKLRNGLGEELQIEPDCLYPLFKSGELAKSKDGQARRWLIVPQRFVGDDTERLAVTAPKTWQYLMKHAARFDGRRSSIYRGQPRFAIFGIGDYSFAPWKVAVSGLAKELRFSVAGPRDGRPVMFDDTSYFLACRDESDAAAKVSMLNSDLAQDFFSARIFWDAKRPVTAEVLRQLDLAKLAAVYSDSDF